MIRRLLLLAVLSSGCSSTPPPEARPAPPDAPARLPRSDQSFLRARALARSGAPSETPELDSLALQAARTTPGLRLVGLLSAPGAAPPDSRLRPGDTIEVKVYGQEDFSGERRIGQDGRVHLFLLGALELSGRTPTEAAELLRKRLEAKYVKQAQVALWIKQRAKAYVEVLGRVREPGTIELREERRLSVHSLLTQAKGLESDADGSRLALIRANAKGAERCYHFSYSELAEAYLQGRQAWLQPGDLLVVPRLPRAYVVGEVKKEGAYPCRSGATLASLIALAEGPSEDADMFRVQLLSGEELRPARDLGAQVRPGQVVFVPQRQRVYLVGAGVTKNGPIELPGSGLSVVQAIAEAGWFTSRAALQKVEILRSTSGRQVRIQVPVREILDGERKEEDYLLRPGDLVFVPETIF